MSKPVTVSEGQDQFLETGFELYRIAQGLHHQHEGERAQYESMRQFYSADEPPAEDEPRSLELEVAEETEVAVDNLQNAAGELLKAARLSDAWIRSR